MSSPSILDLSGKASEDERASSASELHRPMPIRAENINEQGRPRGSSHSQKTKEQSNSTLANNDQASNNSGNDSAPQGILATYLPSPIDLWQSRTATSLFLLPLVFIIYVILQLPLHYNSNTEKIIWQGRAKEVDDLSTGLNGVKKELDTVKCDQAEMKGTVSSLRKRLSKLKERRNAREEYLRAREMERMERERLKKQQQQGMVKDGPITSISMAKALAVARFIAQPNSAEEPEKKDK